MRALLLAAMLVLGAAAFESETTASATAAPSDLPAAADTAMTQAAGILATAASFVESALATAAAAADPIAYTPPPAEDGRLLAEAAKPKRKFCNTTMYALKGDYAYEACGAFCKEAKKVNHCKFCKCKACSFCPKGAAAVGKGVSMVEGAGTPKATKPIKALRKAKKEAKKEKKATKKEKKAFKKAKRKLKEM